MIELDEWPFEMGQFSGSDWYTFFHLYLFMSELKGTGYVGMGRHMEVSARFQRSNEGQRTQVRRRPNGKPIPGQHWRLTFLFERAKLMSSDSGFPVPGPF